MRGAFGLVCLCTVLTAVAVAEMYARRGGFAIGGEWFIGPVLAGVYDTIATIIRK